MGRAAAAFEVIDDGKDRERWLAARRCGIGGSEIATLLGCGYGSPMGVFADKLGMGEPTAETAPMRFGKRYERLLAEDLELLTGRRTKLDGRLLRSRRWPWLISTLDALQWERRRFWGSAELKTTAFDWEGDEQNAAFGGIPPHVYAQVQEQYAVTDHETITCAVFNRLSCLTVYAEVARDERWIECIVETAREFMRRVELGSPPEVDGSEDTARALAKLYPRPVEGKVRVLDASWLEVADQWADAKRRKKQAEDDERALRNRVLAELGDAEVGALPDGARFVARLIEKQAYTVKASSYREVRLRERA